MEYLAANMIVVLMMNPTEYRCKLQGFPTAPQFAKCWSDVICLLTGINYHVKPQKSHNYYILIGCRSRERSSGDDYLKQSTGYYMKMTLTIISCHTVSVTISYILPVKRDILLCSR
jgi:hypothetical protein